MPDQDIINLTPGGYNYTKGNPFKLVKDPFIKGPSFRSLKGPSFRSIKGPSFLSF